MQVCLFSAPLPFAYLLWPQRLFCFRLLVSGARLCLGRGLALLEAKLLIVLLLQRFTFDLVPDQKIQYMISVTLQMKYGMKMVPRRRRSAAAPAKH
jgi:cytochrome P450